MTQVFTTSRESIESAAAVLAGGGVVAFPTETVYGLGADATNATALGRVFAAKERPVDNPLIVHISVREMFDRVARDLPPIAKKLADQFWPGPLTLVLRRHPDLPAVVSAGLSTIAVRMPDHPIALALIGASGTPLAAPSANLSGRPSSTRAEHVVADFGEKIDGVIDGGPCPGGIESTVLGLIEEPARILRPGAIPLEALAAVLGYLPEIARDRAEASPGTRHRHYRPRAIVRIFEGDPPVDSAAAYLTLTCDRPASAFGFRAGSIEEFAQRLYSFFRDVDARGIRSIYVEQPPAEGLGMALRDRLTKAADS